MSYDPLLFETPPKRYAPLSRIPMFERGDLTNKSFYKTTYKEGYTKPESPRRDDNPYNYQDLSSRLESKYTSKLSKSMGVMDGAGTGNLSFNYPNYSPRYMKDKSDEDQRMNLPMVSLTSETKSAYHNDLYNGLVVYKKTQIPEYIKKDTYHSNSDVNIKHLKMHDGGIVSVVPNEESSNKFQF
jgi:hypothetical protein